MKQNTIPNLVGVGAVFIDDIVLPNGTTHMAQLGGGVVHALMGAAIWGEKPGILALAGSDLPDSIRQRLEKHLDIRGLRYLDLPQIRAWQIFEADGMRRELYRVKVTEPFIRGAQPHHLPDAYHHSRAYYLLQHFDGIRAWRAAVEGIVVWEPLQQVMSSDNRQLLNAVLREIRIDVISPNLAEAQAVYGMTEPEKLVEAMLNEGARAAALRMGPDGSLIGSQANQSCIYIPAVSVHKIIDQTGAGNTYCGALALGLAQGKSVYEAGLMGAVAASFCIEQIGVVDPDRVQPAERDRRLAGLIG